MRDPDPSSRLFEAKDKLLRLRRATGQWKQVKINENDDEPDLPATRKDDTKSQKERLSFFPNFSNCLYSYSSQDKGNSLLLQPPSDEQTGPLHFLRNESWYMPPLPMFNDKEVFILSNPKEILTNANIKEYLASHQVGKMEIDENEQTAFLIQTRKANIIFRKEAEEKDKSLRVKQNFNAVKGHRRESTLSDSERFEKTTKELFALVEEVSANAAENYQGTINQMKSPHNPYSFKEDVQQGEWSDNVYVGNSLQMRHFRHERELFDEFNALVHLLCGAVPMTNTRVQRCITKEEELAHKIAASKVKSTRAKHRRTNINKDCKQTKLNIDQIKKDMKKANKHVTRPFCTDTALRIEKIAKIRVVLKRTARQGRQSFIGGNTSSSVADKRTENARMRRCSRLIAFSVQAALLDGRIEAPNSKTWRTAKRHSILSTSVLMKSAPESALKMNMVVSENAESDTDSSSEPTDTGSGVISSEPTDTGSGVIRLNPFQRNDEYRNEACGGENARQIEVEPAHNDTVGEQNFREFLSESTSLICSKAHILTGSFLMHPQTSESNDKALPVEGETEFEVGQSIRSRQMSTRSGSKQKDPLEEENITAFDCSGLEDGEENAFKSTALSGLDNDNINDSKEFTTSGVTASSESTDAATNNCLDLNRTQRGSPKVDMDNAFENGFNGDSRYRESLGGDGVSLVQDATVQERIAVQEGEEDVNHQFSVPTNKLLQKEERNEFDSLVGNDLDTMFVLESLERGDDCSSASFFKSAQKSVTSHVEHLKILPGQIGDGNLEALHDKKLHHTTPSISVIVKQQNPKHWSHKLPFAGHDDLRGQSVATRHSVVDPFIIDGGGNRIESSNSASTALQEIQYEEDGFDTTFVRNSDAENRSGTIVLLGQCKTVDASTEKLVFSLPGAMPLPPETRVRVAEVFAQLQLSLPIQLQTLMRWTSALKSSQPQIMKAQPPTMPRRESSAINAASLSRKLSSSRLVVEILPAVEKAARLIQIRERQLLLFRKLKNKDRTRQAVEVSTRRLTELLSGLLHSFDEDLLFRDAPYIQKMQGDFEYD